MKVVGLAIVVVALASRVATASSGCHPSSAVVGYHTCGFFGEWSRDTHVPRLWVDLGFVHRNFVAGDFHFDGLTPEGRPGDLSTTMNGMEMRGLGGIGRYLYVGFDLQGAGMGVVPRISSTTPSTGSFGATHAIVGVHHDLFRIGFAAELATGFRYAGFDCGAPRCAPKDDEHRTQFSGELEARLRADIFVASQLTVGIMYGHSVLDHDDSTVVVDFGIHLRAMDGM